MRMSFIFCWWAYLGLMIRFSFVLMLCLTFATGTQAKEAPPIEILNSDVYKFKKTGRQTLKILSGHVKIKQGGDVLIECDSMNEYSKPHLMKMYKRVKVKYGNETTVFSDYMEYYPDEGKSIFEGHVVLKKEKSTLYTAAAKYDKEQDLFVYSTPGKFINATATLTSKKGGIYNGKTKLSTFYEDVHLVDTSTDLKADSLRYDGNKEILYIISPSVIVDTKTGRKLLASSGYLANGEKSDETFLTSRPEVFDSAFYLTADTIHYYKKNKYAILMGDAHLYDSTNNMLIKADSITMDDQHQQFIALKDPIVYMYRTPTNPYVLRADSIFGDIHDNYPDEVFSPILIEKGNNISAPEQVEKANLTNTRENNTKLLVDTAFSDGDKDSLDLANEPDAEEKTDTAKDQKRFFKAYHNVRLYSDSMQMYCDSAYYSSIDSTVRMMNTPILWLQDNEIKGNVIYAHLKNKNIDLIHVPTKSFVHAQEFDSLYSQARAKSLTYYTNPKKEGNDSIILKTNAKMAYFVKDEEGYYVSYDRASSNDVIIYLDKEGKMQSTKFIGDYEGKHYPPDNIPSTELYIDGFNNLNNLRPTSIEYIESYADTLKLLRKKPETDSVSDSKKSQFFSELTSSNQVSPLPLTSQVFYRKRHNTFLISEKRLTLLTN